MRFAYTLLALGPLAACAWLFQQHWSGDESLAYVIVGGFIVVASLILTALGLLLRHFAKRSGNSQLVFNVATGIASLPLLAFVCLSLLYIYILV